METERRLTKRQRFTTSERWDRINKNETPYNQEILEINEENIEYTINAGLMWDVTLDQIREIIIIFSNEK